MTRRHLLAASAPAAALSASAATGHGIGGFIEFALAPRLDHLVELA